MRVLDRPLPDLLLLELEAFADERGFFRESFHFQRYADLGVSGPFVQDDHSRSCAGVLRGLHFQRQHAQGKLVSVMRGAVWDVALDLRRSSPSFGRWFGTELSDVNHRQLWIPPGFAHGFVVLSEWADMHYRCTDVYHPESAWVVRWDDPALAIDWPCERPLLSAKDAAAPRLADLPADCLFD